MALSRPTGIFIKQKALMHADLEDGEYYLLHSQPIPQKPEIVLEKV